MFTTSIQKNQIIRLHISHRLSIMRFLDEYKKEKKQDYVKNKMIENMTIDENLIDGGDGEFDNPYVDYLQKNFYQKKMFTNQRKRKKNQKD